jgi:periplasmic mercuric ion binding protein
MKAKLLALFSVLFLLISVPASAQRMTEQTIKTSAECEFCKTSIEKLLGDMKGIKRATVNIATKELVVKYNTKKITIDEIRIALSNAGYDADDVKANNKAKKINCLNPDSPK